MTEADDLMATMADVCDRVIGRTPRRDSKTAASGKRLGTAMGAVGAATARNALVGYIDLMTLVMLQRLSFEDAWAKKYFDETDRLEILDTLKSEEKEIWAGGEAMLRPGQIEELKKAVMVWRAANPDQVNLAFARLQEFASERQVPLVGPEAPRESSIFSLLMIDPLAKLDPASRQIEETRLAGERVAYWAQRLPMITAWQVEWTVARMSDQPPMSDVLKNIDAMSTSATRLSASYEKTLAMIPEERKAAITQMNEAAQQAGLSVVHGATTQMTQLVQTTTSQLAAERVAAVDQLHKAFAESLTGFAKDLKEGMGSATSSSIDQSARVIAMEREKFSEEAESKISRLEAAADRLVYRVGGMGLFLVVAAGLIQLVVGWVNRRAGARAGAGK